LQKLEKSRQNHGLKLIAQYAFKKSLIYCISVTSHGRPPAPCFGSHLTELEYWQTKNIVKVEH